MRFRFRGNVGGAVRTLVLPRGEARLGSAGSSDVTEEHRQKVMRTGFQKHLEKPVAPAELVTKVARLAGRLDGIPCR